MNELTLSDNLAQIELEINHHKQIAGQSIWEIGRRLNHVKEHDLAHGQFEKWVESLGMATSEARKFMTVAKKLPNRSTLNDLGTSALYLIATLPDEEKQTQLERIENGDNPTVRELQEVRRQLKLAQSDNERLRANNENLAEQILEKAKPEIIEKEVIKEVVPDDYKATKQLNSTLLDKNKDLQRQYDDVKSRNEFVEKQLQDLYAKRAEVDEKSAKYDELTQAIEQSKGQLDSYQKKIFAFKEIQSLLKKGNQMLSNMGGIVYIDIKPVIETEPAVRNELETFSFMLNSFAKEVSDLLGEADVIEGEIL